MATTAVIFADVSFVSIGGTQVEGIIGASVNEPADVRPIYTWGKATPAVKISVVTMGTGSLTYVAGNGSNSGLDDNWKALLDGTKDIVITGGLVTGNSSVSTGTQSVTLKKALYQGKSFGMNARNEGTVTINFTFDDGLNG